MLCDIKSDDPNITWHYASRIIVEDMPFSGRFAQGPVIEGYVAVILDTCNPDIIGIDGYLSSVYSPKEKGKE
jgi:hypothetical protein